MRDSCIIKSIRIFTQYFPNFSVGFGKVLMHSTLVAMARKWCKILDGDGEIGVTLTDL